jgi:hypothetical protein
MMQDGGWVRAGGTGSVLLYLSYAKSRGEVKIGGFGGKGPVFREKMATFRGKVPDFGHFGVCNSFVFEVFAAKSFVSHGGGRGCDICDVRPLE